MEEQVRSIVEKYLRPLVQADGGDLEVVEIVEHRVMVRLVGACRGCPGRRYTVGKVIEPALRRHVDDAIRVRSC